MQHRKFMKHKTMSFKAILFVCLLFVDNAISYVNTQQSLPSQSSQRPSSTLVSEKYFGTPLGAFHSPGTVKGEVFIVDDSTLFLRGFSFTGSSYPFSFFHAGASPGPDGTGFNIADERGSTRPLADYRDKDIVVRLPEGRSARDIRWLSIWSRTIHANLGHVFVPVNAVIPAPLELPPITGLEHGVRSGPISIVDAQTVLLTDFWYDGTGPTAYFWVTRGDRQTAQGLRLKDENDTPRPLRPYRGESFLIRLPDLKTIYDFDWFGIWSEEYQIDMGHFHLPQHVRVPPSSRMLGIKPEHKLNCEVLDDRRGFELRWVMDGDDVVVQLVAKLQPREYMAFGLSKDDHRSLMTGADAAVAWIDKAGIGHAVDYFLGSKEQCVGNRGSCPDLKHNGATDSITLMHSAIVNGFTMVTFKRPQLAVDELYDQHIYSDGQQGVVWSIGTLNARNEVSYHNLRTIGNRYMDFARPPTWNCPRPDETLLSHRRFQRLSVAASKNHSQAPTTPLRSSKPQVPQAQSGSEAVAEPTATEGESSVHASHRTLPAWKVPVIRCPRERTFIAQIGPAGKARGYSAITGRIGQPIAWYINGLLVPELVLKRGQVYTFLIEGGDDIDSIERRHPLYLTDNVEGGFQFRSNEERMRERVIAGVGLTANGTVAPTAEGRLCEWKEPSSIDANSFERFEDYRSTLRLDCQENGRPGMLRFKADEKTPEVLYYQDFMHKNLGWRIRIVDDCDDPKPSTSGQVLHTVAASIPRPVKVAPPLQIKSSETQSEVKAKANVKKHPQMQQQAPQHFQQHPNKHFSPAQHPLTHQLLGGTPIIFNRANFNLLPHTLLQPFKQGQQNHFNHPMTGQRPYLPVFSPQQHLLLKQQPHSTQHQNKPKPQQQPQLQNLPNISQQSQKVPVHLPIASNQFSFPPMSEPSIAIQSVKFPMKKIGQQVQTQYFPNNNRRVHHSNSPPPQKSLRPLRPNKVPSMASGFVPISLDQQITLKEQQSPSSPQEQHGHGQQHKPKQGYRYKIRKVAKPLKHRGPHDGDLFRLSAIKPTTPKALEQTTTAASKTIMTTTPVPQTITTAAAVTQTTTISPVTIDLKTFTTDSPTTIATIFTAVTPTTTTTAPISSVETTTSSSVSELPATTTVSPSTKHDPEHSPNVPTTTEEALLHDMSLEESQRRLVMSTLNGFKSTSDTKSGSFDHVLSQSEQQATTNPDDSILSDVMRMISQNMSNMRQKQRHEPQFMISHRTPAHDLF